MAIVETARMTVRGQIVIPKQIRDFLNAKNNSIFSIAALDSETVILKKLDKEKILADFAKIRENVKKAGITRKDVELAIKEARAE